MKIELLTNEADPTPFEHPTGMRLHALLLTSLALHPLISSSESVAVRYPEGSVHGYLALRSLDGKLLAAGDLVQTIHGSRLTSHLIYRFKDGSIDDETAVFTQAGRFRLSRDHHTQKGPSFPLASDLTIDVHTGMVTVRYVDDGKLKVESDHMDLPEDLSNGILINLAQNISPDKPETTISYLAATPKPKIVRLSLKPDGIDSFRSAGIRNKAQRYRVHVALGGLAGFVAPIIGREPSDSEIWVSFGEVPAFIKAECPLFLGGPLIRMEMSEPIWSRTKTRSH